MNRREAQAEAALLGARARAILGELEREIAGGGTLESWLGREARRGTDGRRPLDEDFVCAAHICWRALSLNANSRVAKPVEIVKAALHGHAEALRTRREHMLQDPADMPATPPALSERTVDRLIFNRNYWRDAYWGRVVEAAGTETAPALLNALSVDKCVGDDLSLMDKGTNLNLRNMSQQDVVAEFERSCPPFAQNRRRGVHGPIVDFKAQVKKLDEGTRDRLAPIVAQMDAETTRYEDLRGRRDAFGCYYELLPAWCASAVTPLFGADLWDTQLSLSMLIELLGTQFGRCGHTQETCDLFVRQTRQALSEYLLWIDDGENRTGTAAQDMDVPSLLDTLAHDKSTQPRYETRGYPSLPRWLISKEQIVWDVVACSVYGPEHVRPQIAEVGGTVTVGADEAISKVRAPQERVLSAGSGIVTLERLHGTTDGMGQDFVLKRVEHVCAIDLGRDSSATLDDQLVIVLGREFRLEGDGRHTVQFSSGPFSYQETRDKHYATHQPADGGRHLAVFVRDGRLKLKDLDSKNGTIVERDRNTGIRVLVMPGRNARLRTDALANEQEARVVGEVDACLGDIIRLGGSWFRIV